MAGTIAPTLTILICTHNRAELLLRTLAYLDAAKRPASWAVDVLVVANACSDGTVACLKRYRAENPGGLPLAWFEVAAPGKSNALNEAAARLKAQWVAFVDDDHRVDERYLVSLAEAVECYPDADFYCGRILPDWDGQEPGWVHDRGPYRIYPLPVPRFDLGDEPRQLGLDTALPGGGNLYLKREWLQKVGRFSPEFGPTGHDLGGAEDLEWVRRALRLGARLRYVPSVVQYHYVDHERLTLPYVIKKAFMRSASTVRLSEPPASGIVPRFMYRKLAEYFIAAATAMGRDKRRFYLVRLAAALGEFRGYFYLWSDRRRGRVLGGTEGSE